jgi:hypothetical protein
MSSSANDNQDCDDGLIKPYLTKIKDNNPYFTEVKHNIIDINTLVLDNTMYFNRDESKEETSEKKTSEKEKEIITKIKDKSISL